MLRWNSYPFFRYLVAYAVGIIAWYLKPELYLHAFICLSVSLIALLLLFQTRQFLLIGVFGFLSLSSVSCLLTHYKNLSFSPHHRGLELKAVTGYVAVVEGQEEFRKKTIRLELELNRARTREGWKPASGRVIVYMDHTFPQKPRYGDRWLVRGAPREIDPPLNPGEFNYKRFLAFRGIFHQQYLQPFEVRVLGNQPPSALTALAYRAYAWADSLLTVHLGHGDEFAFVKAMVLGLRDRIDPELQQAYSAAGAVHVLSVSGLHVGILYLALAFVLGFLRKGRFGKGVFTVLMLSILWFYALMTGFSAPVLRSALMFSMVLTGQALGRSHHPFNTLCAAAFLILLFDPFALFSAGFQLSFMAVGGMVLFQNDLYRLFTVRNRAGDWLWNLTATALVTQCLTFPLVIYYFHQFPLWFWLANPVIIPLSSLVLVLAIGLPVVSWVPFLAEGVGKLLFGAMWLLNQVVRWTEMLPGSVLKPLVITPFELGILIGLMISAVFLGYRRSQAWA